jgi:hypothetical protein
MLVARRLRQKTKVSVEWLAQQLGVQTRGGMSAGMHEVSRQLQRDGMLRTKPIACAQVDRFRLDLADFGGIIVAVLASRQATGEI